VRAREGRALTRTSPCSILPPHILLAISRNGSARQRDAALATISVDASFRALRTRPGLLPAEGRPGVEQGRQRTIYDARGAEGLPGLGVRREGEGPTGDAAVDEAYEGLGATFDFFLACYGRRSVDDEALPLLGTVHYGRDYDNAFWNGRQMVFGDGDGDLFRRFTLCLDIIGHELTHGVTGDEAGLRYALQPGALNESISDVFGSLVKQYALGQTAREADWLIGAGLFTAKVQGQALRSLAAPGTAYDDPVLGRDPQPAHMDEWVRTDDDNGGVHINSGIPNRAFFLVATELDGPAWERAGRIWYETLRDPKLRSSTGFRRFARLSLGAADKLFGVGSREREAVRNGWEQVGVEVR
jgi:Zn-dependent metalloprotease